MNWLIDAHLPRRLAYQMRDAGHDVIHTLDLPTGNHTSDQEINQRSVAELRIVITKDADFVHSFWLYQQPYKLLLISTGNITNNALLAMMDSHLSLLTKHFCSTTLLRSINPSSLFTGDKSSLVLIPLRHDSYAHKLPGAALYRFPALSP